MRLCSPGHFGGSGMRAILARTLIAVSTLWRFFARRRYTRTKKTGHAQEQDRPDVLKRREDWFDARLDLDPTTLVFVDETGASTKMARLDGRAAKGERLRMAVPHGRWKTTTFIGGFRLTGMTAPPVIDGRTTGTWFETWVSAAIEAVGVRLLFLPPCSPDLDPIEMALSKLKALRAQGRRAQR
jgi:hypothetical protein